MLVHGSPIHKAIVVAPRFSQGSGPRFARFAQIFRPRQLQRPRVPQRQTVQIFLQGRALQRDGVTDGQPTGGGVLFAAGRAAVLSAAGRAMLADGAFQFGGERGALRAIIPQRAIVPRFHGPYCMDDARFLIDLQPQDLGPVRGRPVGAIETGGAFDVQHGLFFGACPKEKKKKI